jgi:S1-C subfamily serine protease
MMSEPQPGPEDLSGSEEWTTPEPEHTQPIPAGPGDAGGWPPPPPPPPGGADPSAPGGYPWASYPAGGYPTGGYPTGGYPGGGYPGGRYAGGGYSAGGYPGGGYPGGGYPGYPGGGYPGSPGGRGRRGRGTAALIAAVAIVAAAMGAGIAYAASSSSPSSSNASQPGSGNSGNQQPFGSGGQQQPSSNVPGAGGPSDVGAIAAKVDPGLVDVNVTFGYQNVGGAGTGIVLTSNGEVLTNNHVIDGATSISVTDLGNGQTYGATVVGYDNTHDMAVLQLNGASGLHTATISTSAPTVGEAVVAIGNVGGKGGTPTASGGSITALDQSIDASDSLDNSVEQLSGLIETNADVQEGDSGGSLVNSAGQVVGMDTAASSSYSFQSQGAEGFAIPITQVTATAREVEAGDGSTVVHVGATAFLGVQVETEGDNTGGGLPGQGGSSGSTGSGAFIENVISGGAAQQAGLQDGDVITSLAGQTVDSPTDLTKILVRYHPGDSVTIGWTDQEGQSHTATISLGSGPPA